MTDDIREQKLTERLKEAMDAMELAWQEYLATNYPTSVPRRCTVRGAHRLTYVRRSLPAANLPWRSIT
jgi:hypothetical protein